MTPLPDWQSLSLAQQVAQMVIVRASGHLFDHQIQYPLWEPPAARLKGWLHDLGVGGVILLGGSAAEVGLRTQQLQSWAKLPLLVAADVEEGVGQRFAGAVWFPPPMAIGAIAAQDLDRALTYASQMGAATAQEALAIGINWVLVPVVDVNNNPANPVINVRAWGETPEMVSQLTAAFIRGAQQYPVLTAAKHFPGHGDTAVDSHLELPLINHDKTRLETVELPPFRSAIAAGVDAVMTAHLQLPIWDPEAPATLSRPILTHLLRHQLGFAGLIVTDALVMGAITRQYGANEAAVRAVAAGADVLMMPADPEGAIEAICAAIESGQIPITQIQASLERIWQAKQKAQPLSDGDTSHAWEQLPPPPIQLEQLAQPQTIATVEAILRDSLRLHRPHPSRLEISAPARNLILVDDALNCTCLNRQAPAITIPSQLGYHLQVVDSYTPAHPDSLPNEPAPTLLQLFIRGNPFRSSASLIQLAEDWLQSLLHTDQLQALVIYGSPYVMDHILTRFQFAPDIPYAFSYGQMPTAQAVALEALLGDLQTESTGGREFTD
ncbi:beta-glucosidase [Leptolyngbya sp. NK1-12]|uniref:beta-N-acetylhexosaminidase n=1 Tax=Leptolyngbya sp. NK1-12 TaxID=2547451 RepID=A0AA96WFU9_9CYAN|nr:beta-glucosidase [Leptolyngbya sp. NK1-12]